MAISLGGQRAEINVTPMIDVLLVLLVIFMLVAPLSTTGLPALVPQPPPAQDLPERPRDIVITVTAGGAVRLNREAVTLAPDLQFRQVAEVIDIARGVGLTRVALMTTP